MVLGITAISGSSEGTTTWILFASVVREWLPFVICLKRTEDVSLRELRIFGW